MLDRRFECERRYVAQSRHRPAAWRVRKLRVRHAPGSIVRKGQGDDVAAPRHQSQRTTLMLSHLSFGVADLNRATAFYEAALAPLGFVCVWRNERAAGFGE